MREAGRELDAEIAEKVMGLEFRPWRYGVPEGWWSVGSTVAYESNTLHAIMPEGYESDLPMYSWDIADAWLVVEKMRTMQIEPELRSIGLNTLWRCTLRCYSDHERGVTSGFFEEEAETAPLAICLAALQTVSGEIPPNGDATR